MQLTISRYIFLLLLILACGTKPREESLSMKEDIGSKNEAFSSEIILINAPDIDRCDIADLIQSLTKCGPKAIGINFLFIERKEGKCDSLLKKAISDSDRVILTEGFEEGKHIESNEQFRNAAFLTGPSGVSQNDQGIASHYYRLIDHRGRWEMSFPFLLALQYDKTRAAELSSKVTPKNYPITVNQGRDSFTVVDYNDHLMGDCNIFSQKIVIVGYLGTEAIDKFQINTSSRTEYGTIIIANVILDILKDLE
jgi:CHASE2 domain-containing sensor protein